MIKRFFLDRIDRKSGWPAVADSVKLSAVVLSYVAEARLSFANLTVAGTKRTENFPLINMFPPSSKNLVIDFSFHNNSNSERLILIRSLTYESLIN